MGSTYLKYLETIPRCPG